MSVGFVELQLGSGEQIEAGLVALAFQQVDSQRRGVAQPASENERPTCGCYAASASKDLEWTNARARCNRLGRCDQEQPSAKAEERADFDGPCRPGSPNQGECVRKPLIDLVATKGERSNDH